MVLRSCVNSLLFHVLPAVAPEFCCLKIRSETEILDLSINDIL